MVEAVQQTPTGVVEPRAAARNGSALRFERGISSQRVAVIDIGSNSTRMEVLQITADYDLRVVSEVKALLRLQSRINSRGEFERGAVKDLKRVIRDFSAVAAASHVEIVRAVATASFRNARNRERVLQDICDETGIQVEIVSGEAEARYGFLGAIAALPVYDGVLIDIGGGSVEITSFRDREMVGASTTALGALRVTDQFLRHDPPTAEQVRALRQHVRQTLADADVVAPPADGVIVGAGGTIRNIAKIDRARRGRTFSRLHGAEVSYDSLKRVIRTLSAVDQRDRARTPGLNPERAGSVLGGTLVMGEIARHFGKRDFVVSGRGLREGLAIAQVIDGLPTVEEVRTRSIYALGQRFDTWNRQRADRRAALVVKMRDLLSEQIADEMSAVIPHAARIIDTGRSINYYDRYEHAAIIAEKGELGGFAHRDIGLMAAAVRHSADSGFPLKAYRPYIKRGDISQVKKAAILLRLADEMERRLDQTNFSRIKMRIADDRFVVTAAELKSWSPGRLATRFKRLFGLSFCVR